MEVNITCPLNVKQYKAEEIFKQDGEYKMIIPEILEQQGWKVGDTPKFDVGDKGTIIITQPMIQIKKINVVVIESVPEDAQK